MNQRLERIRYVEEIGFRTWPALERLRYDGWELRAAGGVTRRSNSVNPVVRSSLALEEKIDFCEQWFAERGQSPVFRLTDLAEPELQPTLEHRGYVSRSPTEVMIGPVAHRPQTPVVRVDPHVTDTWFAAFCKWNGRDPAAAPTMRALLESIPGTCGFASLRPQETIVSVGLAVVHGGLVGIYNMNTDPALRRRGFGATILDSLLAFGAARGATASFLQVLAGNEAAQRLYTQAGFRCLYDYWYLE